MGSFKLTPKQARARLVKALRSGNYKQGRLRLRSKSDLFCCLGVACDLYHKIEFEGEEDPWKLNASNSSYSFGPSEDDQFLPISVQDWLGFADPQGSIFELVHLYGTLSNRNDAGDSFEKIARLIETGKVLLVGEEV